MFTNTYPQLPASQIGSAEVVLQHPVEIMVKKRNLSQVGKCVQHVIHVSANLLYEDLDMLGCVKPMQTISTFNKMAWLKEATCSVNTSTTETHPAFLMYRICFTFFQEQRAIVKKRFLHNLHTLKVGGALLFKAKHCNNLVI